MHSVRSRSLALLLVVAACGAPAAVDDAGRELDAGGATDASPRDAGPMDAGTADASALDADTTDARTADAGALDAGEHDAGDHDAGEHDAGAAESDGGAASRTMLLVGGNTTFSSMPSYAADFRDGAWSTPVVLGSGDYSAAGGGGVTFLADGRAIAVVQALSSASMRSAVWDAGTWSALTAFSGAVGRSSAPARTSSGALIAGVPTDRAGPVSVAEYDASAATWSGWVSTGIIIGDFYTRPAAANGASNEPIVLASDLANYVWAQRIGGSWSGGAVPGVTPPPASGAAPGRSIAAVAIAGTDRFLVALGANGGEVVVLELAAGAWSAPRTLATDLVPFGNRQTIAMTALPDGRAVLVYVTASDQIGGALYDAGSWTSMPTIPSVTTRVCATAIALAPGLEPGVAAELVFVRNTRRPFHARLTDPATWTWTTPALIASDEWGAVHVASF